MQYKLGNWGGGMRPRRVRKSYLWGGESECLDQIDGLPNSDCKPTAQSICLPVGVPSYELAAIWRSYLQSIEIGGVKYRMCPYVPSR